MASVSPSLADRIGRSERSSSNGFITSTNAGPSAEANSSGVSWAAVAAGAVVAAALSLALLALGTGLGLSVVSPWAGDGASASAMGTASIVYLIAMQVVAAAMGGYLAGRLRTKWTGVHNDEVYFRDTAHGFLVWAVGLVLTASLLASAASAIIGGAAKAGATAAAASGSVIAAAGGAAVVAGAGNKTSDSAEGSGLNPYLIDGLFRAPALQSNGMTGGVTNVPQAYAVTPNDSSSASIRSEAARIVVNGMTEMPATDKAYLAQLIASKTGIAAAEAEKRITDLQAQIKAKETAAREAADTARKAAAKLALWMFLGLLMGAFFASLAATIGGRQRDRVIV